VGYTAVAGGFIFLLSSIGRHTSLKRDWSSDVCSADLGAGLECAAAEPPCSAAAHSSPAPARTPSRVWDWKAWTSCAQSKKKPDRSEERRVGKGGRNEG